MIAVDARENQIFLHIFTSPCFMQNQNVLILITVPTFLLITDHHPAVDRDDAFLHQVHDLMAVCDNDHRCSTPVDLLRSPMISIALWGSRFPVGSSASRISGRLISARAIATRCCSPPES